MMSNYLNLFAIYLRTFNIQIDDKMVKFYTETTELKIKYKSMIIKYPE